MGGKGGRQKSEGKERGEAKEVGKIHIAQRGTFLVESQVKRKKKELFKAPQCSDGIYIAMRNSPPKKKMPLLQNSPGKTNNSYHHVSTLCMRSRRQYASRFFCFPASRIKL